MQTFFLSLSLLLIVFSTQSFGKKHGGGRFNSFGGGGGRLVGGGSNNDFVPVTCDIPESCGLRRSNETGVLVCRASSYRKKRKHSNGNIAANRTVCVKLEEGLAGDNCGCCGGICPVACTTPCARTDDAPGSLTGVLMMSTKKNRTKCVSPSDSITVQAKGRKVCA